MICPCGGLTRNSVYKVKSMNKAKKWLNAVANTDLPISVDQKVCTSCGRQLIRVVNVDDIHLG